MFLARDDGSGSLVCATLLGGPNHDRTYALEIAPDGDVVLAGRAGPGFPTTDGVVQRSFGGDEVVTRLYGEQDGFVAKLSSDCGRLRWSTLAGQRERFCVMSRWTAAAYTSSQPLSSGPRRSIVGAATHIAWSLRCRSRQAERRWSCDSMGDLSRRVGRGRRRVDPGVDNNHQAYVLIDTHSDDAPVSAGAAQPRPGGGSGDLYLVKLAADGRSRVYATYLGGNRVEGGETHNLALFPDGAAVVGAFTRSTDWPITPGAVQASHADAGAHGDALLAVVSPLGSALTAVTYLGGSGEDAFEGVAVDAQGGFAPGSTNAGMANDVRRRSIESVRSRGRVRGYSGPGRCPALGQHVNRRLSWRRPPFNCRGSGRPIVGRRHLAIAEHRVAHAPQPSRAGPDDGLWDLIPVP